MSCGDAQAQVLRPGAHQRVGRQAVGGPLAQVAVCRRHGRHCKALLVLLQQQACHLRTCRQSLVKHKAGLEAHIACELNRQGEPADHA